MKHDDIVLMANKENLVRLLHGYFGKRGCWSSFHWVVNEEVEEWKPTKVCELFSYLLTHGHRHETEIDRFNTLSELKEMFGKASKVINELPLECSINIEKTLEYPLIKGEDQYKCTKGFIDLIVHAKAARGLEFTTHEIKTSIEFIIEIKKETDFKDFGAILRQIKEYKEYYGGYGVKRWESDIIPKNDVHVPEVDRRYCILSTKIPENIKEVFSDEKILCLELDNLDKLDNKKKDGLKQND